MQNIQKENTSNPFVKLTILTIIVLLMWGLSGYLTYYFISDWSDRGTFGDMFGAVNALFSGLAFAALIYTIFLQREEIRMNRKEIQLNRKELKKSTAAQIDSQLSLKEQASQTHLTAKINAISTIINYYNLQISNPNNNEEIIQKAKLKRKKLIMDIDNLIDGIDDSNVE